MRAIVVNSRSFIRPALFDLELEWTVGAGGGGRAKRSNLHFPTPTPLLILTDDEPPSWYKFLSLLSLDNQYIVFLSSITEQVVEHHLQDIDNLSIPSDIGHDEGDHFDASQPVASKWYLFFHFPIPFYNGVTEDFVNFIQTEISAISKHKNCVS